MALARLDVPSVMLYGGSIPPGRFHGRDVTILDVFEAVGARGRRADDRRGARRARVGRQPRRGRVRRPVHRQHDGDGVRDDGHQPDGPVRRSGPGADEGRGRLRGRPSGDRRAAPGPAPARPHHARVARERDRRGHELAVDRPTAFCTCWRSPARWASSWRSTTSTAISERTPLLCDLSPRAAPTTPSTCTRPVARPCSPAGSSELGVLHADAPTVLGRTVGELADAARGGRGSAGRAAARRAAQADRRAGDPARQPRPRGLRGQARRPRAAPPQRAGPRLRGRGGGDGGRHSTARSAPATSS